MPSHISVVDKSDDFMTAPNFFMKGSLSEWNHAVAVMRTIYLVFFLTAITYKMLVPGVRNSEYDYMRFTKICTQITYELYL